MRWEGSRARDMLALTLAAQGELARARALFLQNMIVLRDLGALRELAELFGSMMATWRLEGATDECSFLLRLAGAGSSLLENLNSPMSPSAAAQVERNLTELRAHVGAARIDAWWAEGRLMTWPAAIAYALKPRRASDVTRAE